jgi:hypothetical protein
MNANVFQYKNKNLTFASYVFIGEYDTYWPVEPYEKTGTTIKEFGALFKDEHGLEVILKGIDLLEINMDLYYGLVDFKNKY